MPNTIDHRTNVWNRCLEQMFGTDVPNRRLEQVFGTDVWNKCLERMFYRTDVQLHKNSEKI